MLNDLILNDMRQGSLTQALRLYSKSASSNSSCPLIERSLIVEES